MSVRPSAAARVVNSRVPRSARTDTFRDRLRSVLAVGVHNLALGSGAPGATAAATGAPGDGAGGSENMDTRGSESGGDDDDDDDNDDESLRDRVMRMPSADDDDDDDDDQDMEDDEGYTPTSPRYGSPDSGYRPTSPLYSPTEDPPGSDDATNEYADRVKRRPVHNPETQTRRHGPREHILYMSEP